MNWLIFALLAPVCWSFNIIFDKFMLTKRIQDPFVFNIFSLLVSAPVVLVFLFVPISFSFPWFFLGILNGLLLSASFFVYNKALKKEEASIIISLVYIKPIIVVFLAWLLLSESLSISKYAGIVLIVLSSILISYIKPQKKIFLFSVLVLVLIVAFLWAISNILAKYIMLDIDYWSLLFWTTVGGLISIPLWLLRPDIRASFAKTVKSVDKKIYLYFIFNEAIYTLGELFFFIATSLGLVSIVAAISGLQPFFILIFALMLSIFVPSILKEVIDRKTVLLKLIAVILIFIGSWLIVI
jgi:uncharacterized membrane protein